MIYLFFQVNRALIFGENLIFYDLLQKLVSAYLQPTFLTVEGDLIPSLKKKTSKVLTFEPLFGVLSSLGSERISYL